MTVTMTLEEYLEYKQAKDNLEMCIEAAQQCTIQGRYCGGINYLIKCLATQDWHSIEITFDKPQE